MFKFSEETSNKTVGLANAGINDYHFTGASLDDKGNLKVSFKGASLDNPGTFTHTSFASNFEVSEQNDAAAVERSIKQIQEITEAFVPADEAFKITTLAQLAAALNKTDKTKTYKLKLILNNKDFPNFPSYSFISSELKPRSLSLSPKINPKTNAPYDRVLPLANYVKATTASPDSEDPFANVDLQSTNDEFGGLVM